MVQIWLLFLHRNCSSYKQGQNEFFPRFFTGRFEKKLSSRFADDWVYQYALDSFASKTYLIASDISACPNLYLHASILNVRQKHQTSCAEWLNSKLVSVLVKLFSHQSVILLTSSKIQPRTIHHTYTPSELQISHANYFLGTQFKMKVFTSLA